VVNLEAARRAGKGTARRLEPEKATRATGAAGGHRAPNNHVFSKRLGPGIGTSLAIDSSASVLVAGFLAASSDPSLGMVSGDLSDGAPPSHYAPDRYDVAAKFDSTGTPAWARRFPEIGTPVAAVDAQGNIFLAGMSAGPIDLGGGLMTSEDSSADIYYVVKYDPVGRYLWSKPIAAAWIGIAPDGGVLLLTSSSFNPTGAAFLTKLDNAGNLLWNKRLGYDTNLSASWVVSSNGDVFAAGEIPIGMDLNPTRAHPPYFVLARFDPSGTLVWSRPFGGYAGHGGIATDPSGNVVVAGAFEGQLDVTSAVRRLCPPRRASRAAEKESSSSSTIRMATTCGADVSTPCDSRPPLESSTFASRSRSKTSSCPAATPSDAHVRTSASIVLRSMGYLRVQE
jgi:hypothetical protein